MFVAPISGLPLDDLFGSIAEQSGQMAALHCRLLLNIAELDARPYNGFDVGCKSAAHWLAGRLGMDMASAWETLRVARRLVTLPAITQAFACGQLPYSQVRALVRIATQETEQAMVEMARMATGAQFRRMVEGYRRVLASYADPKAPSSARELNYGFDADGFWIKGRLPAEQGAIVRQALDAAAEQMRAESKRSDLADLAEDEAPGRAAIPVAANRADALVAVAETSLTHGLACRPGSERTQVVVHVDAETLSGTGTGEHCGGEHCEIEQAAEIAPETARRLACDAAVVALVESAGGEVLSVGRKTRKVNPALARAVRCRDKGCTFPGCGQTIFTDNHHIEHWARGGETSLTNLTQLCGFHHGLVHEGGYHVVRDPGTKALVFSRPDGRVIDKVRMVTGPHDGQLDLPIDIANNDRRDGRTRVQYHDIMRYFAQFDSRLPKEPPPPRPPDPEPDPSGADPPEDQDT